MALAACGSDTPATEPSAVPSEAIVLPETTDPQPTNPAADSVADLEVDDQYGNGRSVTVTSVILGRGPAWLTISDLGGNVLGVKEVSPRTQPVTVNLQPPVTMSQELLAALYLDDGDGSFDAEKDTLMVDEDGEPVSEDFDYIVQ
ncbi:MAG: hypothetical protein R2720_07200 [Candidatus Nanopelagicales bacterium]